MSHELFETEWNIEKKARVGETITHLLAVKNIQIDLSGDRLDALEWIINHVKFYTLYGDSLHKVLGCVSEIILDKPWLHDNGLTPKFIMRHPQWEWDWEELSRDIFIGFSFDLLKKTCNAPWQWRHISAKSDLTMAFIEDNIEFPWDWSQFHCSNDITVEFVQKYIDKPWDWDDLSSMTNLTFEFVKKHMKRPWNWRKLSHHENLTFEFIEANIYYMPWDWYSLSSLEYIPVSFVKNHMDKPWDWEALIACSNLTFEFVNEHMTKPYWDILSKHDNLNFKTVEKHINNPWDWYSLSDHRNLTEEFLLHHLHYPWNWDAIISNRVFSLKFISANKELLWQSSSACAHTNWDALSNNPNVTPEFIEEHIDEPWNWSALSAFNERLTSEFIEKHIDKPWSFNRLCTNDCLSLSCEFVEKHINENWYWGGDADFRDTCGLSENTNLTCEFVIKHMDKDWNWDRLIATNTNLTCEFFLDHLSTNNQEDDCDWHFIFTNKHLTFQFLKERVMDDELDKPMSDFSEMRLYDNEFSIDHENFLRACWRKEFMRLGGLYNQIVERICKPPCLTDPDYEPKMDAFIAKMHHLGFDLYQQETDTFV